jgi:hypothetical protein
MTFHCDFCGHAFERPACHARLYKRHFCTLDCRKAGLVASAHPHWKGGELIHPHGYRRITLPTGGTVWEHRRVMEQHLGRSLSAKEHVHHRDGNKQNNSIDNLELITAAAHASLHHKGKPWTPARRAALIRQRAARTPEGLLDQKADPIDAELDPAISG